MLAQIRLASLKHALLAGTAAGALALLSGSAAADVSLGFSYFDLDRSDDFDGGTTSLSIGASFSDGDSYASFGTSTIGYSTNYVHYGFGRSYSYFNACRPRVFYGCTSYSPVFAAYDPFAYRPFVSYPLYSTYGYVTPVYATTYVDPYCTPAVFAPSYTYCAPAYVAPVYCAPAYYPFSTYSYYRPSYGFGISISFGFGHNRRYRHFAPSYYDCYDPFRPIYCPPVARSRPHSRDGRFAQVGPAPASSVTERPAFAPVGDGRVAFQRPSVEARGQMGPAFNSGPSTISPGAMKSLAPLPAGNSAGTTSFNNGNVGRPVATMRPDAPGAMGPRPDAPTTGTPGNARPMPIAKTAPGAFKPVGPVAKPTATAAPSAPAPVAGLPKPITSVTPAVKPMPVVKNDPPVRSFKSPEAPAMKVPQPIAKPVESPRITITPSKAPAPRPQAAAPQIERKAPTTSAGPNSSAPMPLPRREFNAPKSAPAVTTRPAPASAPIVAPSRAPAQEFRQAPTARPSISSAPARETREVRSAPQQSAPRAAPARQPAFKPIDRGSAAPSRSAGPSMGPAPRPSAAPKAAPAPMKPAAGPSRAMPAGGQREKK